MARESRRRNRRINRKLEAIFRRAGLNCGVSATTAEGKRLGLLDDNDFPPWIDDRAQYGSEPGIQIITIDSEGVTVSSPPQAVCKEAEGPEPITDDSERPEILEFALRRTQEIREKLSAFGVRDVELKEIILTRPFPPVHLTRFRGKAGCRRLTDEEIWAILSGPNESEFYKNLIRADLEALPYYEWVGGIFSDECWRLVRYAGIRLLISAFIPNDAVDRLLNESDTVNA